ncbi:MAG: hypothetical protein KBG02_03825 [Haliscomenobacter sp.]|nr:hypothetical protein [Haliscomenobacter sp.]MBP9075964.1 hypothetical protein [Haliscomenobacter sp.]
MDLRPWATALVLSWIGIGQLSASESPRVFHFDKKTYQAHNQNWSIAQDDQGILYFGNTDGLLEYDGSTWDLHPFPRNQPVRSVAYEANRIYAGGYEEFGFWEKNSWGQMQYTSLSKRIPQSQMSRQEIWHILVTSKGVFFQSFGAIYLYENQNVRKIELPGNIMFLHEINGQILAPVLGSGIFAWSAAETWSLLPGSAIFADKTIQVLLADPGGMLAGTKEAGFFRYNGREFLRWEHPMNGRLTSFQVNKAIRLKDGRIAVGTILNGLYLLEPNRPNFLHFNRSRQLQNNTVLSLMEDQQGNVWAGLDQGIDMIAFSDPLEYYEDTQGKIGTVYAAALHEGKLFLGTNQGLFYQSFSSNAREAQGFTLVPGTQGQVWQLLEVDGELICGHNQGTFLIRNLNAKSISPVTGGWHLVRWPGKPNRMLQATYTGIAIFDKNPDGKWSFSGKLNELSNYPIRRILPDSRGNLWAVNPYEGAFRLMLSPEGDAVLKIDTINRASGLKGDYSLDLFLDQKQPLIWSNDRYFFWNESSRFCQPYTLGNPEENGLPQGKRIRKPNGEEFIILPQRIGWIQKGRLKAWLPISLVKNNEQIEQLNDSLFLFCLDNGYALLNRYKPMNAIPKRPPVFRLIQPLNNGRPLESDRREKEKQPAALLITTRSTSFLVRFAHPVYTQVPSFRYRIPGWQEEWSSWSTNAVKLLAGLPPGDHTLLLQSSLSHEVSALNLSIKPQWYQTWWAGVLYLFIALALAGLLYRMHRQRLKLQRRKLLIEKEKQLHEHLLKARTEQLQADVLNKSQELANSTFNLIRKNETLLQIKEALAKVKTDLGDRLPDKYHARLIRLIDSHLTSEHDWQVFETNFNQVHEVFLHKLKKDFPELTPGDLRLAAYLKMNLSSKEIAPLLNISVRGVENKRYRLRQKLQLEGDDNLTAFLMQYN